LIGKGEREEIKCKREEKAKGGARVLMPKTKAAAMKSETHTIALGQRGKRPGGDQAGSTKTEQGVLPTNITCSLEGGGEATGEGKKRSLRSQRRKTRN